MIHEYLFKQRRGEGGVTPYGVKYMAKENQSQTLRPLHRSSSNQLIKHLLVSFSFIQNLLKKASMATDAHTNLDLPSCLSRCNKSCNAVTLQYMWGENDFPLTHSVLLPSLMTQFSGGAYLLYSNRLLMLYYS